MSLPICQRGDADDHRLGRFHRSNTKSQEILNQMVPMALSLVVGNIVENVFTFNVSCWISYYFLLDIINGWSRCGKDSQYWASECASKDGSFSVLRIHICAHPGWNTGNVFKALWHQTGKPRTPLWLWLISLIGVMSHVLYLLIKSASGADGIWEQHILIRKSRICISERENERGKRWRGGQIKSWEFWHWSTGWPSVQSAGWQAEI